jgi:hypothetical protein
MKTPILGASYVAASINAANDRCINLYPEVVQQGGKEPAFLRRAPGLKPVVQLTGGPIRGMFTITPTGYTNPQVPDNDGKDLLFVVTADDALGAATRFWLVESDYGTTLRSTITTNIGAGPVSMAFNGTQLFIACSDLSGTSYIYNADTNQLQQITDPDFPGASSVGYLDGYFVFSEPNSQKLWVTDLLDGTSVDPLDFASAEGAPDTIVSLLVSNREVWVFGQTSTEVWYNAGGPDFPLERIAGAFNEIGCVARHSTTKVSNRVFWLGRNQEGQGIVYQSNGYIGERVSTHAIETAIRTYGDVSDAIGMAYQQDGHSFYALTFPSANKTWVYDLSTGLWHERAGWEDGNFTRYRPNTMALFNGKIVAGDFENGKLYELDPDTYTDNGGVQRWLRSWRALPTGQNTLMRTAQHSLQLDCQAGVGLATGQGSDPQVMLRWSDDGGHTWSNEYWRSMGAVGETGQRVIWRRLGMTLKLRDRVYEISGTDPVKIAIMGAELQAGLTNA